MAYQVTIGIPVYNVEKYIRLAMDSALAQSFESIEFLVCDDCGTDGSMDIVRDYQCNHPRGKDIRIVCQPRNMKLGSARNRIIKEARGKYLYHLDADDAITPYTIEVLYNAAKQYQAEIVYGSSEWIHVYGDNDRVELCQYPFTQFSKADEFANWVYRKYDGIQANTWNFLIDIDIYRKNHIQHQPINFWEDFTVTMDLPTYITRAVLLPDITYKYYLRNGSLSNFQKRERIDKGEIVKTIAAIETVKANSARISSKPYFSKRCYKLMMTCFYMVCSILRNKNVIQPSFTKREIRDVMRSPLSLREILLFRQARLGNLILYLLGVLPPSLSVLLVKLFARARHLI